MRADALHPPPVPRSPAAAVGEPASAAGPADAAANLSQLERARRRDWQILAVATFVVVMAFALDVLPGGTRVAFRGLHQWPLPETCPARALSGRDCPGCGLTRSFVLLAHGRFRESVHMHHVGWLMAFAVLVQFPYRLLSLRRPGRVLVPRVVLLLFGWGVWLALVVNWLVTKVI